MNVRLSEAVGNGRKASDGADRCSRPGLLGAEVPEAGLSTRMAVESSGQRSFTGRDSGSSLEGWPRRQACRTVTARSTTPAACWAFQPVACLLGGRRGSGAVPLPCRFAIDRWLARWAPGGVSPHGLKPCVAPGSRGVPPAFEPPPAQGLRRVPLGEVLPQLRGGDSDVAQRRRWVASRWSVGLDRTQHRRSRRSAAARGLAPARTQRSRPGDSQGCAATTCANAAVSFLA